MIAHLNDIEPYTEYTQCHFISEEILWRNYFLLTPQGLICDMYLLDYEDYEYRSRSDFSACRHFSRGVIFTRARVSLALLSLRKNGGLLVVYVSARKLVITEHHNKINRLKK